MGKTIVITSGKGGVGKTTTTANLGAGLAKNGKKVVLIDADIGLRNLDGVMGLENRIVRNLVNVVQSDYDFDRALVKDKKSDNLFLLPASQIHDKDAVSPEQMQEICKRLIEQFQFDYVLVDCPAGIERGFKNAIAGADEAIIVTNPEFSAVRDADRIVGLLSSEGKNNIYLIVNKVRPSMVSKQNMLSTGDIIENLQIKLLGEIPDDEQVIISTNRGEAIVLNERSKAGQAYRNIVQRIEGKKIPFLDMHSEENFVSRLKKIIGLN